MSSHSKVKPKLRGFSQLLLMSLFLFILSSAAAPFPDVPPSQPENEVLLFQETVTAFSVEGRLVPRQYVTLSTSSDGQVAELFVQEGDWVEAGDVLLRLGDQEQLEADLAAIELELISARRSLDDLHVNAGLELALAKKSLAETQKVLAFADDKVESLKKPTSQAKIEQTYANLNLAENRLKDINEEIQKTENKFANKDSLWWWFLNQRDFKHLLTNLDKSRANAERRVIDARQKYGDMREPVDPVDLAMAETDLALAQANVAELEGEIEALQNGPDADDIALVEARIKAAEAALVATETALEELALIAPISGKVIDLKKKAGEWAEANQPLIQLADTTRWIVETDDLTEIEVPDVYVGQSVAVIPDAIPDLELSGEVESISDLFVEKRGDITYTARIKLKETDPRLRWGMTVVATFKE